MMEKDQPRPLTHCVRNRLRSIQNTTPSPIGEPARRDSAASLIAALASLIAALTGLATLLLQAL
jgi:hypothetical protein